MSWIMVSLTLALSIATVGILVEWIARHEHPRRLFLLSLGRERTADDDARARRLRIANGVVTLAGVAIAFAPVPEAVRVAAVTVCPLLSIGWMTVEMVGAVRSAELERVPGRFVVSLDDPPTVRDLVSAPLQVLNVALLVVPCAVFAWMLSWLDGRLPMHFDAAGNVDRYGSPNELWFMAALLVFDLALLWGITWGLSRERWALPESQTERYAELQLARRRTMTRMLEWIMAIVNATIAFVWLGIPLLSLPMFSDWVGALSIAAVVLSTLGTLAPLAYYVPRLTELKDQIRAIAGTEVLGTRHAGWRWGGLVYYAPEDPALFIPKRVGIGQTLNFARPAAWVLLGFAVVVPILISLGAVIVAA